ncbi:response regulator [Deltaproteobacteria bacterium TL4]
MTSILVVDDDRYFTEVCTQLLESFGYEVDVLIDSQYLFETLKNIPVDLILMDIHMPKIDGLTLLTQLKTKIDYQNIPVIMLTADQSSNTLEKCLEEGAIDFINKPLNETILRARVQSILKRIKAEKKLSQTQKMQSLGTLAGGIAHDMNNILSIIVGYSELYLSQYTIPPFNSKYIENSITAALRGKHVIQQLLNFAQSEEQPLAPISVSSLIKDAVQMAQITFPVNIQIVENTHPDCPAILGDESQLYQVLVNLIMNAKETMGTKKGVFEIRAERKNLEAPSPLIPEMPTGEYLHLMIKDTGLGMSPEVKDRAFEPFFTTKGLGGTYLGPSKEGTGLGLSIVYSVIRRHEGFIALESQFGEGTTVHLYFPALKEQSAITTEWTQPVSHSEPLSSDRQSQRILIAEDEMLVAEALKVSLEQEGHQVTSCQNGNEAWETFRKTPEQFDLLITDQSMPLLMGTQLSLKIHEMRPEFPVILITGFSSQVSQENAKNFGIRIYLMKPISLKELNSAIKEVI